MKKPKLPKVKLPKVLKLPARLTRRKAPETLISEAIQNLPRITNETVAEHREEVLSSARKYIYPLSHSKHRVVKISVTLLVAAIVLFFAFIILALYKFQSTSGFVYGVTQVIPFPIAKAGPSYVAYENYLFELRHYMHYYETQQKVTFTTESGKKQLETYKKSALQQVTDDAYVKQLASKNHVSVSNKEVDAEVALVRSQNRLGSSDQAFANVLSEFWGWSISDFKRELKQQLLAQKVVAKLDIGTQARANAALAQLTGGTDFATLAAQVSDDTSTKGNGGQYGILISQSNRDLAPQAVAELFKLKPGQISPIIDTGYSLEIDKLLEVSGDKVSAAHIVFNFQPISAYINPLKTTEKPHTYLKIK